LPELVAVWNRSQKARPEIILRWGLDSLLSQGITISLLVITNR